MNAEIPTETGVILPENLEAICRFYTILLKCNGFVVVVALPETIADIGVDQEFPTSLLLSNRIHRYASSRI
ncbi:hypothetical protein SAMN05192561_105151 [Halopenitus malekzadehii]|uniref:Uncharacterized protein n=1 Tax=Halopenitus malekzadehii TaxID=1267564 RepID=A0A1H6J5R4_9EURY|nr:hypothetical protein SAMN05192561_105151 [Halopenitus malekzadehii]